MIATPLYSIRLNVALKGQLELIAEREGRTLSYLIDKALTEYVKRHATKSKRASR